MKNGVLAGYPVEDVKVKLFDGSFHDVDSSEMAFKIAGSMAFKEAARKAEPGDPRTDHGGRSGDAGRVHGRRHRRSELAAREDRRDDPAQGCAGRSRRWCRCRRCSATRRTLRSMTQGRAIYSMELSHYDEAPKSVSDQIIEKIKGKEA